MLEYIVGKHGIGGIAEARCHTQQQAAGRSCQLPAHDTADQRAAQQRQQQRCHLAPRDRRFPQYRTHQHHKGRGEVQQNACHRQRALRLTLEIHQTQAENTDKTAAEKPRQMAQLNAEHAAARDGKYRRQQKQRAEIADAHPLEHGHIQFAQRAVEKADQAPAHRAKDNIQIGKVLFHRFLSISLHMVFIIQPTDRVGVNILPNTSEILIITHHVVIVGDLPKLFAG